MLDESSFFHPLENLSALFVNSLVLTFVFRKKKKQLWCQKDEKIAK